MIELTPHGRAAVEAGRAARKAVSARKLGLLDAPEEFLASLNRLGEVTGALRELLTRRLRP
ncbi:hypothetical protein [Microbispora bryophytorum]|uniref:hypothetical protein n=1 Tax=Microbispora bryophytorum TaxID=1460882 RepID=UPI0033C7DCAB